MKEENISTSLAASYERNYISLDTKKDEI